jgi:hypothetical protein
MFLPAIGLLLLRWRMIAGGTGSTILSPLLYTEDGQKPEAGGRQSSALFPRDGIPRAQSGR